jgi:acetylornithine deacetylase
MNTQQWLAKLISFDTTSRHSNLPLIECIQAWFQDHQLSTRITKDPDEPKANLFATLPAKDGNVQGGLILSGHTDVVPVDGQQWQTNPFEAVLKDGAIYGRGACDMKGFIAVTLALLPEFQQMQLPFPLHFAYSYDEEVGCRGAPYIIQDFLAAGIKPKACIVGEPTDMHPIVAHKGLEAYQCRVHGKAMHSSLTPQACNAIEYAAKIISFIRNLGEQFRVEGPFDPHFDVPYTTIGTNLLSGGVALNVVPALCEFKFEFRYLHQVKPEEVHSKILHYINSEVVPEMQQAHPDSHVELIKLVSPPSFAVDEKEPIAQIARAITGKTEIRKVAYATEAGQFQAANIPTIVCGPGNIAQAHTANEYVTIAQLQECERFLRELVQRVSF